MRKENKSSPIRAFTEAYAVATIGDYIIKRLIEETAKEYGIDIEDVEKERDGILDQLSFEFGQGK